MTGNRRISFRRHSSLVEISLRKEIAGVRQRSKFPQGYGKLPISTKVFTRLLPPRTSAIQREAR